MQPNQTILMFFTMTKANNNKVKGNATILAELRSLYKEACEKNDSKSIEAIDSRMEEYDWFDEQIEENGKVGVVNALGEVVVPPLYDEVLIRFRIRIDVTNHYNYIVKNEGKVGVVNIDNPDRCVIPMEYDSINPFFIFGYYVIEKDNKFGVFDMHGKQVAPFAIDSFLEPMGQVRLFRSAGKVGCIVPFLDNEYIPAIYDYIEYDNIDAPYIFYLNGEKGYVTEDGMFVNEEQEKDEDYVLIGEYLWDNGM